MRVYLGHEEEEMTWGLGVVSNQGAKTVILEWRTWWKWLALSPLAWRASIGGLKVLTLVPDPSRISPQTHVTYGWQRVLMHKHYNMSMHQFFLCFVDMIGYMLCVFEYWFLICVLFVFKMLLIFSFFYCFCVKNPKTHKKLKIQKVCSLCWVFVSKHVLPCTFVLMALRI